MDDIHQGHQLLNAERSSSRPSLFSVASRLCLTTLDAVFDRIRSDQAQHWDWLQGLDPRHDTEASCIRAKLHCNRSIWFRDKKHRRPQPWRDGMEIGRSSLASGGDFVVKKPVDARTILALACMLLSTQPNRTWEQLPFIKLTKRGQLPYLREDARTTQFPAPIVSRVQRPVCFEYQLRQGCAQDCLPSAR
jgi:hypothetical protein